MIGRFIRRLFGLGRMPVPPVSARRPMSVVSTVDIEPPAGALSAEEIDDRFHRLLYGLPPARATTLSTEEQMVLRRVRDAFGGERIDVATLPRMPAIVPIMMRTLHGDRSDVRALLRHIDRDPMLAEEIVHAVNHSPHAAVGTVHDVSRALARIGPLGLRRAVMQVAMRPILRRDADPAARATGERLWEHAGRSARVCAMLVPASEDPFEAWLAGLVGLVGTQHVLSELEGCRHRASLGCSRPFVAALARQGERLALHAARQWELPPRVVQALTERADPADGGVRTPLGRAVLAGTRVAMLDVLIEQGLAEPDAVLLATASQGIAQSTLIACREQLRTPRPVPAES